MKQYIDSPVAPGKRAVLTPTWKEQEYRGRKYRYCDYVYVCEATGEGFYTEESGDASLLQVWNQYRQDMGIPYPSEFAALRRRLGLSKVGMSRLLGFGENQWSEFESDSMPSVSNGRYVRTLIDNPEALLLLVNRSDAMTYSQRERAIFEIELWIEESKARKVCFRHRVGLSSGCCPQEVQKVMNMILFFLKERGGECKTVLNKLLFYSDFLMYNREGRGISGLSYCALPYGAVPDGFKKIYALFDEIDERENGDNTLLVALEDYDSEVFQPEELEVMRQVAERFKDCNSRQISEICHAEDAWLTYKDTPSQPISYNTAFTLRAFD